MKKSAIIFSLLFLVLFISAACGTICLPGQMKTDDGQCQQKITNRCCVVRDISNNVIGCSGQEVDDTLCRDHYLSLGSTQFINQNCKDVTSCSSVINKCFGNMSHGEEGNYIYNILPEASQCNTLGTSQYEDECKLMDDGTLEIYDKYCAKGCNSLTGKCYGESTIIQDPNLVLDINFDEGTPYDYSSYHNIGNLMNGANIERGIGVKSSSALHLDGTDDCLEITDSNSLDLPNQYTISMWLKPEYTDKNGVNYQIISKSDFTLNQRSWNYINQLSFDGINNKAYLRVNGANSDNGIRGIAQYPTTKFVFPNSWFNLIITYDGTAANTQKLKYYIDGVELPYWIINSDIGGIPFNNNNPVTIGGTRNNGLSCQTPFKGSIDEIKIYNKKLTIEEITNLVSLYPCQLTESVCLDNKLLVCNNGQRTDSICATNQVCDPILKQCTNLNNPLKLYLTFDDNYPDDYSLYKNNGSLLQGANLIIEGTNRVLNLSGVDEYLTFPKSDSLNISKNAISVSMWLKPDYNNQIGYFYFLGKQMFPSTNPYAQYGITWGKYWDQDNVRWLKEQIYFNLANGGLGTPLRSVREDKWTHIVGTYDGSQIKVYLNGGLSVSKAVTGNIGQNQGTVLEIGKLAISFMYYTRGRVDEISIYNKSLSQEEINSLFNNVCNKFINCNSDADCGVNSKCFNPGTCQAFCSACGIENPPTIGKCVTPDTSRSCIDQCDSDTECKTLGPSYTCRNPDKSCTESFCTECTADSDCLIIGKAKCIDTKLFGLPSPNSRCVKCRNDADCGCVSCSDGRGVICGSCDETLGYCGMWSIPNSQNCGSKYCPTDFPNCNQYW